MGDEEDYFEFVEVGGGFCPIPRQVGTYTFVVGIAASGLMYCSLFIIQRSIPGIVSCDRL